jgi:hypothetical protein
LIQDRLPDLKGPTAGYQGLTVGCFEAYDELIPKREMYDWFVKRDKLYGVDDGQDRSALVKYHHDESMTLLGRHIKKSPRDLDAMRIVARLYEFSGKKKALGKMQALIEVAEIRRQSVRSTVQTQTQTQTQTHPKTHTKKASTSSCDDSGCFKRRATK